MAHDKLDAAGERAEDAYRAVLAATTRVSRIHAEPPLTASDVDTLITDLAACRSTLDVFSATVSEVQENAKSHSNLEESAPTQTFVLTLDKKRDKLDREGVMLWNRSSVLRHLLSRSTATPDANEATSVPNTRRLNEQRLIAFIRLTALQFIHAGTPLQSGEDSTGNAYSVDDAVRLLDLYSKAITEMTGCDEFELAGKASDLSSNLLHEVQQISNIKDYDHSKISCATAKSAMIAYNLTCSYLGDATNCQQLLKRATDLVDGQSSASHDIEAVVQHLYQISCLGSKRPTALRTAPKKQTKSKKSSKVPETYSDSETRVDMVQIVTWLRQGLELLNREEVSAVHCQNRSIEWRVKLLRALARTYLSDSYQNSTADAEAAVDDLLRFETTFRTNKAKLRLLLRRNAPDADIDASLDACSQSMSCRETDITDLIKEIHQVPPSNSSFVRKSLRKIIEALLARHKKSGLSWLYLPFMAFCLGLTSSQNDAGDLESLLHLIAENEDARFYHFQPEVTFACQSHLWKLADSQLKQGNFMLAATWYRLITSHLFSALEGSNGTRANRKRALCLLRADRIDEASEVIGPGSCISASDHYIHFLCAGLENREQQAIDAMHNMVNCEDFQLDMLLWATKQAQQYQLRELFQACLRKLIELAAQDIAYNGLSCLALIRALVSDTIEEIQELSDEDSQAFLRAIAELLSAAVHVIRHYHDTSSSAVLTERCGRIRNAMWFYKKAVHLAKRYVELVPPEDIYGLVEHARVFASLLLEDAHINTIDVEEVERLSGSEAILALSSRLFKLEKYVGLDTEGSTDESYKETMSTILQDLEDFNNAWQAGEGPSLVPLDLQASAFAIKFEVLARYQRWQEAVACLDNCRRHVKSLPVSLFQRLVQVACSSLDSPAELTTHALEVTFLAAMHASRYLIAAPPQILMEVMCSRNDVNISQVAKFIRAIVATTLERDNNTIATQYLEAASTLIDRAGKAFPRAEAVWLCTVCWNVGIDFVNTDTTQALYWCSRAIHFASSIPGFVDTQELMQLQYSKLQNAYLAT